MGLGSGGAVDWPILDDLKLRLDVTSSDWDDQLDNVLAAAISATKTRIGNWDDALDDPDEQISQSALELAVELAQTGETAISTLRSKSNALLYGKRRRFGIS